MKLEYPPRLALIKGADLWVLSSPHNLWNLQIDWYLHFQLRQYEPPPPHPSPPNQPINTKSPHGSKTSSTGKITAAFQPPPNSSNPLPLLIKNTSRLACRWILQLKHHPEWLKEIHQIWQKLHKPRIRVFIPPSVSIEKLKLYGWQYVKESPLYAKYPR